MKYCMNFYLYVDDTQLFLSFDSCVPYTSHAAIIQLESCNAEIWAWMLINKLKLNNDKTEFLHPPDPSTAKTINHSQTIQISADQFSLGSQAKNLGVILDPCLFLGTHITSTCKAMNYYLYHLSRIRKYLTPKALKVAVHAFISSKLDNCNSFLIGLPLTETGKLQNIIYSVACLISGVKKFGPFCQAII